MSDGKPKRAARDAGPNEIAPGEAIPTETAAIIIPEAPAAPEAASAPAIIVPETAPQAVWESVDPAAAAADDPWTALADMQVALARGFEEIAVEMTGMTRSGIAAAADAAMAMLGARTFAEAVEINAGLARRGADAMIEGSVKLSDIGVKAVTEASRPILSRLGATWSAGPG
jgi:hypothetical protein